MNLVQLLHSGLVQDLHSSGMRNLPSGRLNAKNPFRPGGKYFPQARMQELHSGRWISSLQNAKSALRISGNYKLAHSHPKYTERFELAPTLHTLQKCKVEGR